MRTSVTRWAMGSVAIAALLLNPAVNAQERFSDITGTVVDQSGGAIAGVVVTVTNNETKRSVVVSTGPDGTYYARSLEPGRYTIQYDSPGFTIKEAQNVSLLLGKTIKVDATLLVGGLTEVVQIVGETPLIDIGATTRGHNVPAEEFDIMPKGRSFQSLAVTAPSVNAGYDFAGVEGGITVNGASAGENNFTVDGVSVNSQLYGQQRQDAIFEHIQEVQVKTTGLAAEYGGALGGVISAVTKSGGNEWRGSLLYYYTGGNLMSHNGVSQRLAIDPVTLNDAEILQDDAQTFSRQEVGGSIGGPVVRDKLFVFASVVPRFNSQTRDYQLSSGNTEPITRDETLWSAFGKLTWEASSRLRFNLSSLYTTTNSEGTIFAWDGSEPNTATSSLTTIEAQRDRGYEIPQYNVAATMDYTISPTTLFSIRAGYFSDDFSVTGVNPGQTYEYDTSSVGLAGVPAQYQQPLGYTNLPRVQIADFDKTTRRFINAELTKAFHGAGAHNFKAGFGFLRSTNDVATGYPNGGFVSVFWDSAYTSPVTNTTNRGEFGYYTIDDLGTFGYTSGDIWHLYVQDSWQVSSRVTLNLGVRLENETIPSYRTDIAPILVKFGWGDKIAPRLGFAWDVRGDGKIKVSGAYGRYFDWTKYELSRGSFGGDVWTTRYRSLDDPDPTLLSREALTGRHLLDDQADSFRDHRVPSFDTVDPDIKPMAQDTFNGGVEYQISNNTVVGVNFVYTNLLRTIEDIGSVVNGNEVYVYANPGHGLAQKMITYTATESFDTPEAERNYRALELTVNRRFANNWFLGGSYVWSRLDGNYPGIVNSDEIIEPGRAWSADQQAGGTSTRPGTNVSRAWDLDQLLFDSHGNKGVNGLLPTDRTHVFKLYGSYQFDFGTTLGFNVYAGSGTPLSTQVGDQFAIPLLVDGRGSLGRTDFLSRTDLYVAHDIPLGGAKRLRLEVNILNLFNQRTERYRYSQLNRWRVNSSAMNVLAEDMTQGYDYNALLAQTPDAQRSGVSRSGYEDPRFGLTQMWNPGFQARLQVRFTF